MEKSSRLERMFGLADDKTAARLRQIHENPALLVLQDIAEYRRGLIDHAKKCTACKAPGKKARAAFDAALQDVADVSLNAVHVLVQQALFTLSDDGRAAGFNADAAGIVARAASGAAQNAVVTMRSIMARMHDPDLDFAMFDELAAIIRPLADAIEANRAKANPKGMH